MGTRKLTSSSFHPHINGGNEHVNYTMAQMLSMVVNECQDDWDAYPPQIQFAYNNSVSAATNLAPNEVHLGRLPCLPLMIFERTFADGHQNLDYDQLASYDLTRDRQL